MASGSEAHPHCVRPAKAPAALLALALAAGPAISQAGIIGPPDAAGPQRTLRAAERIIAEIESMDGIGLSRVSDALDLWWSDGPGPSWATVRARYAGYDNAFGVVDAVGGFHPVLDASSMGARSGVVASGHGDVIYVDGLLADDGLFPHGAFRPAIRTPTGDLWSSIPTDNRDGADHMVTWVDDADPNHYFVAFEDLPEAHSDHDYNDLVVELFAVIDGPDPLGPAQIDEPATALLALLALAALRRRAGA